MMKTTREAFQVYSQRGYHCVPIPPGHKYPIIPNWQQLRLTEKDFDAYFGNGEGIGLLLGDLVDVDLDSPEARGLADLLPPTQMIHGRPGSRTSHYWYVVDQPVRTLRFQDPGGRKTNGSRHCLIELRGSGGQTVVPPSIHPTGEAYQWQQLGEPAPVSVQQLQVTVTMIAAMALLVRHWQAGIRQDAAMALTGALLRAGWTEAEVETLLRRVAEVAQDDEPEKRIEAVRHTADRLTNGNGSVTGWTSLAKLIGEDVARAVQQWLGGQQGVIGCGSRSQPPQGSRRPQILVTNRHLRDITAEGMQALEDANNPPTVFVRMGRLVRVVLDEQGCAKIDPLCPDALRGLLARCADFVRTGTGGIPVPTNPPDKVVQDLNALPEKRFPPLVGVIETPTIRPDGTLVITPGYDPATRLLYTPPPGFVVPPVPDVPSATEIQNAVDVLSEVICDFPFIDDASRANALAAMITAVVRSLIDGPVPLVLLDKPQPGTGASLLASVIALITTGQPAAMLTPRQSDEEWRKSITTILLSGANVIIVDNLEGNVDAPSLSTALTASVWEDRVLGRLEEVRLPIRVMWMATGDNISVGDDHARRCYQVRMDAQHARPWQRTGFKHDPLLPWVQEHRGDLVWAILCLARAWFAAGKPIPPSIPVMGNYECWTKTVGGILGNAGITGFLGNLDQMYETTDTETPQWSGFLEAWYQSFQDNVVSAAIIATALGGNAFLPASGAISKMIDAAPDELLDTTGKGFTKRIGKALAKRTDVYYPNGYSLQRVGTQNGAVKWRVVQK